MKKNILKICAVLLVLVLLFALASCGGRDKGKGTSETTGTTDNTGEKDTEGGLVTEKTDDADSGKKQTADKTNETATPSGEQQTGGKTEETTSATEPEENEIEGEMVIPSEEIHLPIVDLK